MATFTPKHQRQSEYLVQELDLHMQYRTGVQEVQYSTGVHKGKYSTVEV